MLDARAIRTILDALNTSKAALVEETEYNQVLYEKLVEIGTHSLLNDGSPEIKPGDALIKMADEIAAESEDPDDSIGGWIPFTGNLSLREAVLEVLKRAPALLTKDVIVDRLRQDGYVHNGKHSIIESVRPVLNYLIRTGKIEKRTSGDSVLFSYNSIAETEPPINS